MDRAPATFGIEEEFVLLDPRTLRTADLGLRAVGDLRETCPGIVTREFFPSQIEYATPVCTDAASALAAVGGFRRALAAWAEHADVVVAPAGTPFAVSSRAPDWQGRYREIARDIAGLAAEHQLNGLHVHVGIPDRDAGVRASNALRPWLPVLLGLSANSPFWQGVDTGFASWRAIHSRRWTTYGIPPRFADAADYDAVLDRLTGIGATSDAGTINWYARLSASHPTLEVRVCDVQLDGPSGVALACVIRALASAAFEGRPPGDAAKTPGDATPVDAVPGDAALWDAATWHAARYGAAATLVSPVTQRLAPASAVIAELAQHVAPFLAAGERSLVGRFLATVQHRGDGASRQRRAHLRGDLPGLYRGALSADARCDASSVDAAQSGHAARDVAGFSVGAVRDSASPTPGGSTA